MTTAAEAAEFRRRVEELIRSLLGRFDQVDPDELEAEVAEGVLKLTFADGGRCVLNRQSAANQIWLAEGASAWHFEFDDRTGVWLDTKGRGELRAVLGDVIARRLGRRLPLA